MGHESVDIDNLIRDVDRLKKQVESLGERRGGMLSSTDFRELVIRGEDVPVAKELFRKRDWKSIEKKKLGRKFIIDPFDPLNLMPFSYDLSIGGEVFSCRHEERGTRELIEKDDNTYPLEPGETVIVRTKEYIALPPYYSATVWPRFNLVREGIFQSMVKIDPTWYGTLGVALTNLSPAQYPIRKGDQFGTLVLYELIGKTDMDLCLPDEALDSEVRIPLSEEAQNSITQERLREIDLHGKCRLEGGCLCTRVALSNKELRALRTLSGDNKWQAAVENATKVKTMNALGLPTLDLLRGKEPAGTRLTRENLRACKDSDALEVELENAALQYGGPFKWVQAIPNHAFRQAEKHLAPKVQADVSADLFPRLVTLTLSVIGTLSLVAAIIAFVVGRYQLGSPMGGIDWPGTTAWAAVVLGCVVVIALVLLLVVPKCLLTVSRGLGELRKYRRRMKNAEDEIGRLSDEVRKLKATAATLGRLE